MDKKLMAIAVGAIVVVAAALGAAILLSQPQAKKNIMENIKDNSDLDTLETAIVAANLNGTLSGDGPFTVFAPDDSGFGELSGTLLDELINEQQSLLGKILTFHVIEGKVFSKDLTNGQNVTTVQGEALKVTVNTTGVFIGDSKVTQADMECSNGVIHIIDQVLIPPLNILETAIIDDDLDSLVTAVYAADLDTVLIGTGPFTVFAPTDEAFSELGAIVLNNLLNNDTSTLADILRYHVIPGEVMSTDLSDGMTAETVQGKNVLVSINGTGVYINNAKVTVADIQCTNGIVHVIDTVLTIPKTIVETAQADDDLDTLVSAVVAADLVDELNAEGPFTVFAPTDAAFAQLDPQLLNDLVNNKTGILSDILLYHVLNGQVLSTDLSPGTIEVATLNGANLTVTVNATGVFVDGAQVVIADVLCSNGVIHVIDAVLMPPMDIVDTATLNGNFNTLVTALNVTGLDSALRGDGPFTVFAPTDAAFAQLDPQLLNDLVNNDTATLAEILRYHVVNGTIMSTDLTLGITQVATLQGSNITVTVNTTGVFINDARVIIADVICSNGVIHVIDLVLIPPV